MFLRQEKVIYIDVDEIPQTNRKDIILEKAKKIVAESLIKQKYRLMLDNLGIKRYF